MSVQGSQSSVGSRQLVPQVQSKPSKPSAISSGRGRNPSPQAAVSQGSRLGQKFNQNNSRRSGSGGGINRGGRRI